MREAKPLLSPPKTAASVQEIAFQAYRDHSAEVSILVGSFFLRYLGRLYREFKGDLASVIVLGEIGHHNVNHCYSGNGVACQVNSRKANSPALWKEMQPCNAFSLSAATGIPRETVRRKIESLVARGWLQRNSKGEVSITPAVVRHFHSDFDIDVLGELLGLARRVEELVSKAPGRALPPKYSP